MLPDVPVISGQANSLSQKSGDILLNSILFPATRHDCIEAGEQPIEEHPSVESTMVFTIRGDSLESRVDFVSVDRIPHWMRNIRTALSEDLQLPCRISTIQ